MNQASTPAPRRRACPICKRPRVEEFTPFCSNRCRDKDLSAWFNDGYSIGGERVSSDEVEKED